MPTSPITTTTITQVEESAAKVSPAKDDTDLGKVDTTNTTKPAVTPVPKSSNLKTLIDELVLRLMF
jgi:hypothetical protein